MRKTAPRVIYTYTGAGRSLALKVIWKFTLNVKKKNVRSVQFCDTKMKVEGEDSLGGLFKQCSWNWCGPRLTQWTNTYTFIQSLH